MADTSSVMLGDSESNARNKSSQFAYEWNVPTLAEQNNEIKLI